MLQKQPPTSRVIAIPVYNYETHQIEIVTSSVFFKMFRDENEFDIDKYDYCIYYHMAQLPPGFLVRDKSFPQLIITKIGPTRDTTIHTLPSEEELKKFGEEYQQRKIAKMKEINHGE